MSNKRLLTSFENNQGVLIELYIKGEGLHKQYIVRVSEYTEECVGGYLERIQNRLECKSYLNATQYFNQLVKEN